MSIADRIQRRYLLGLMWMLRTLRKFGFETLFYCGICGATVYPDADNARRHMRSVHPELLGPNN